MENEILGNTVLRYLVSLGIFAGLCLFIWIFKTIFLVRLKKLAEKTVTTIDDFIIEVTEKVGAPLLYLIAFYASLHNLIVSDNFKMVVNKIGIVVVTYYGIQAVIMLVNYLVSDVITKKETDVTRLKSVKGLMVIVKGIIWAIGILLLLDNMGYKVSTILAGLGIGGVAVALAAQAFLGDLFSYVFIIFDRPFQVGDFIVVDDFSGTVEDIGVKTTRVRSIDGEEIIFSNSNLTGSRIKNYKRMVSRRVVLTLGVTYSTPVDVLKKIPDVVKNVITGVQGAKFERVHLNVLADSSINFEAVFNVEGSDYVKYMDIKQEINIKVLEELAKLKADLAFPTRTVYVQKQV
jgi:small-conductance mechanosensitive channel